MEEKKQLTNKENKPVADTITESEEYTIEHTEGGAVVQRWYDKTIKRYGSVPKVIERNIERIVIKENKLNKILEALGEKNNPKFIFGYATLNKGYIALKNELEFGYENTQDYTKMFLKANGTNIISARRPGNHRIETTTNRMLGRDKVKSWQMEEMILNIKDLETRVLESGLNV